MDEKPFSLALPHWLALHYTPGLGPVQIQRLLAHCPDPTALFHSQPPRLPDAVRLGADALAWLRNPDWPRIERDLAWAADNGCHVLSLEDPRYPARLKQIPDPPAVLFVRGRPELLDGAQLAMVGSRNPSVGGAQTARAFARELARQGLIITSGLALGIDAASHEGALEAGGCTIAVAGTGPDRIYPARHRDLARRIVDQGAIVSEFPPGTPPLAGNFPRRNRLISALSLGTLVVEAALESGSLITARLAAEQGREVFAIPGSLHNPLSKGCHALIRQGAKLCEDIAHILEELPAETLRAAGTLPPAPPSILCSSLPPAMTDPRQETLLRNIGYEPTAVDTLVERCGLTPETVSAMLVALELQGRVISSGGLYCRTDQSR
jgi:DNA processing protein